MLWRRVACQDIARKKRIRVDAAETKHRGSNRRFDCPPTEVARLVLYCTSIITAVHNKHALTPWTYRPYPYRI